MKLLILCLIVPLLISTCTNWDSNIEIIPNMEWEYLNEKQVTEAAIPLDKNFETKLEDILLEITHNWYLRNDRESGIYPISFTIFIGESGKVESIKDGKKFWISNITPEHQRHPDFQEAYYMDPETIKEIIPYAEEWNFQPANWIGKVVKYQKTFGIIFKADSLNSNKFEIVNSNLNFFPNYINDFFVAVEEMPEPIGGMAAIQKNIKYPEFAKMEGIEGRVYVKAFIDEKGDVLETELLKGIGGGCDQAAIKAVELTKFKPGKQKGKPVKVQVSIPILFKLN